MAKLWRCYTPGCRGIMGTIVKGELILDAASEDVELVSTEGAFVNVTCSKCGRPNRWVPKDSDLVSAVMNTHFAQELIRQSAMLWNRGVSDLKDEEEDAEE